MYRRREPDHRLPIAQAANGLDPMPPHRFGAYRQDHQSCHPADVLEVGPRRFSRLFDRNGDPISGTISHGAFNVFIPFVGAFDCVVIKFRNVGPPVNLKVVNIMSNDERYVSLGLGADYVMVFDEPLLRHWSFKFIVTETAAGALVWYDFYQTEGCRPL